MLFFKDMMANKEKQRRIEQVNDMRNIQMQKGTYDVDDYMKGLYVGLELASATLEGREPEYEPKWAKEE